MLRPLAALLVLALPLSARATEGLEWQLDTASARYRIQAQVHLPELMRFHSELNTETRVSQFKVDLVTTCRPEGEGNKKGWNLVCAIDDVALHAAAVEKGTIQAVLDEWDDTLTDGHLQVSFTRTGRVRNVDLEGVGSDNRRTNEIHETMRLVLSRAIAGLDLELPRKGDDKGKSWKQKSSETVSFPSDVGSMGAVVIVHEVKETDGEQVTIESTGHGTMGTGEMIVIHGTETPKNLFDMTIEGTAVFDLGSGRLVERSYLVDGTPSASSQLADGGAGYPYVQAVQVTLLDDDEAPELGPNGVIDNQGRPTTD